MGPEIEYQNESETACVEHIVTRHQTAWVNCRDAAAVAAGEVPAGGGAGLGDL